MRMFHLGEVIHCIPSSTNDSKRQ